MWNITDTNNKVKYLTHGIWNFYLFLHHLQQLLDLFIRSKVEISLYNYNTFDIWRTIKNYCEDNLKENFNGPKDERDTKRDTEKKERKRERVCVYQLLRNQLLLFSLYELLTNEWQQPETISSPIQPRDAPVRQRALERAWWITSRPIQKLKLRFYVSSWGRIATPLASI